MAYIDRHVAKEHVYPSSNAAFFRFAFVMLTVGVAATAVLGWLVPALR